MKKALLLKLEYPYESLESLHLRATIREDYKSYITGMHFLRQRSVKGIRDTIFSGYDSSNPANFEGKRFQIYEEHYSTLRFNDNPLIIDKKISNLITTEKVMSLDHEEFCLLVAHKSKLSASLDLIKTRACDDIGTKESIGTNDRLYPNSTFEESKEFILHRNTMKFLKEDVGNLLSDVRRTDYFGQLPRCSERQEFEISRFNNACSSIGIDNISVRIGLDDFRLARNVIQTGTCVVVSFLFINPSKLSSELLKSLTNALNSNRPVSVRRG